MDINNMADNYVGNLTSKLEDFPEFDTWAECVSYHDTFLYVGSNLNTHLSTKFDALPNISAVLSAMARAARRPEKLGIVNNYLTEVLRKAAPTQVGLWFLNSKVFDNCMNEITKADYKDLAMLVKESKAVTTTKVDDLKTYARLSKLFRDNLSDYLPPVIFRSTSNEIRKKVGVHAEHLVQLAKILEQLTNKTKETLKGVPSTGNTTCLKDKGQLYSEAHYTEFYDFLTGGEHTGFIDLNKRSASGKGITSDEFPIDSSGANVKQGPLLLSIALEQHIRFGNAKLEDYANSKHSALKHAYNEVKAMMNRNETERSGDVPSYAQQCANMDIVFNFFLQLRAFGWADYVKNPDKRKELNTFLYLLGQKILQKEKIEKILATKKGLYSGLLAYMNKTGSKYMPPYALTESRLYDWVSIFGVLRLGPMQLFALTPGISTRYFTHFKLTSKVAMSALMVLNVLEESTVDSKKNDLTESEHLLHQMLLQNTNCYQSSIDVRGDVFAIEFEYIKSSRPPSLNF